MAAEPGVSYKVRRGDNLSRLAREHRLTVAQLMAWNGLDSETVVPGQRLALRAPAASAGAAATAPPRRPASAVAAAAPRPVRERPAVLPKVHLVQPGDTLFNLSRRFGVSVQLLRELNHLTSDEVRLGQKLLVPQG